MIKVLSVITDSNIGGAGVVLLNFMRETDRTEFDHLAAVPRGSRLTERLRALEVRVVELDGIGENSRAFSPKTLRAFLRLYSEFKPDIVHTHACVSARVAAKIARIPAVFTKHSAFPPNERATRGIGRALFRMATLPFAKRIIAVAPVCRDGLVACGIPENRIDVVLNGAPPPDALTAESREELRRGYGAAGGTFLAVILARVETYKGQDTVIEAAAILRERGRELVILVAGTGTYEAAARKLADDLGVSDFVRFLGFVDDPAPLLGAADAQINASRVEACSLSLIEGMSLGLPAAASDAGGNPLLIRDGENGLLFKTGDADALADALERLIADDALKKRLSDGARRVYAENFTCERTARETEKVYRKILNKSSAEEKYERA